MTSNAMRTFLAVLMFTRTARACCGVTPEILAESILEAARAEAAAYFAERIPTAVDLDHVHPVWTADITVYPSELGTSGPTDVTQSRFVFTLLADELADAPALAQVARGLSSDDELLDIDPGDIRVTIAIAAWCDMTFAAAFPAPHRPAWWVECARYLNRTYAARGRFSARRSLFSRARSARAARGACAAARLPPHFDARARATAAVLGACATADAAVPRCGTNDVARLLDATARRVVNATSLRAGLAALGRSAGK
jgi:hypothetical protein